MKQAQQILWDNDPHALPKTDKERAIVAEQAFVALKKAGKKPADLPNADRRKAYADWLKKST